MGSGAPEESAVAGLVDILYESMLAPEMWQRFVDRAVVAFGADSGHVLSFSGPDQPGFWVRNGMPKIALQAYERHYHRVDPWRAALPPLMPGEVFATRGERLVDDRMFLGSEFYNDFLRPIDQRWMCAVFIRPPARRAAQYAFSVFRAPGREPMDESVERAFGTLGLHMRRAERLALAATLVGDDDESADAALLLSPDGRLVCSNAAGEAMIADGVVTPGEHTLTLGPASADVWLKCLIAARGTLVGQDAGQRLVAAHGDGHRYEFEVVPLRTPGPSLGLRVAKLLLRIRRIASLGVAGAWRAAGFDSFHWTRAEADTVRRLATGETIDAIALARDCSRETVRSHLKSAKRKAGVSRQVDLIRLVMRIADSSASVETAHQAAG